MDNEGNSSLRRLRKYLCIAEEGHVTNRDEGGGGYQMSPIYRPLFTTGNQPSGKPAL